METRVSNLPSRTPSSRSTILRFPSLRCDVSESVVDRGGEYIQSDTNNCVANVETALMAAARKSDTFMMGEEVLVDGGLVSMKRR